MSVCELTLAGNNSERNLQLTKSPYIPQKPVFDSTEQLTFEKFVKMTEEEKFEAISKKRS